MPTKRHLSERDICSKYIHPALQRAGWDRHSQIFEEVSFTDGRIQVEGTRRGPGKRADYILCYKPNIPVAIIEAKDNKHSLSAGIQQALAYAEILDIPSVYSSNGAGFYEHDRSRSTGAIERQLTLDQFPTPDELWRQIPDSHLAALPNCAHAVHLEKEQIFNALVADFLTTQ